MKIPISEIKEKPFQSRQKIDEKEVAALAESIRKNGLLHPVTVRREPGGAGYQLIAGDRRLQAHHLLGLEEIEAEVKDVDDAQAALMAAAENIERENFTPLEEAMAIGLALDGSTIEDVAAAFGRPLGYITRRHRLLQLSADWKKAVDTGFAKDWSIATLIEVARAPEEIQKNLFDEYKHGHGWNDNPTAEQIRNGIFDGERYLKSATFDTSECLKCQRSTCAIPELFDDVVTAKKGDRCMDEQCWSGKTTEAVEAKFAEFKEKNPTGVVIEARSLSIPYDHPVCKNAVDDWEFTRAKKDDSGTVAALNLKTGKIEMVKLSGEAAKKSRKLDADGKTSMKEKRARLEKRRVIRYLEKIIAVIAGMVDKFPGFSYAAIVPLVSIFGAEPLPRKTGYYCNTLDDKFNDGHCQPELFACIAPKMIKALESEKNSADPQKKRGDCFHKFLGIDTEKLYSEACEEIPEPKAWAAQAGTKSSKKETKAASDETPAPKVRACRICGCTDDNACLVDNIPCHWVEADLCSACAENGNREKPTRKKKSKPADLVNDEPPGADMAAARYRFNGHGIFVSAGIGGKEFGTFRVSDGGGGITRIKAKSMPMVKDWDEAQRNLDAFAAGKGLEKIK